MAIFQRIGSRTRKILFFPHTPFISTARFSATPSPIASASPTPTDRPKRDITKDPLTTNSTILAYNKRLASLSRHKAWGPLDQLVVEMAKKKLKPDEVTMSIRLNAYEKQKRSKDVFRAWSEMRAAGIVPDLQIYVPYVMACIREKRREETDAALKEMEQTGIKPDIIFYNRCLDVCCSAENWGGFMGWRTRLLKSKLALTDFTYLSLLTGFQRMDRADLFGATWREFEARGPLPHHAYALYGAWLIGQGKQEEWESLIDSLKKDGRPLTPYFFNGSALALLKTRKWREFDVMVNKAKELKLVDAVTYQLMFQAYAPQERWVDSIRAYDEIMKSRISPDEPIYSFALVACIESNDIERMRSVYDQMANHFTPSAVFFNRWLKVCLRTKRWEIFDELETVMKESGVRSTEAIEGTKRMAMEERAMSGKK